MAKKYTIKPLEWGQYGMAKTPFGHYYAKAASWGFCFDEWYDEESFECVSIDEGKAAAQRHWENRLLKALEEIKS